MMVKHFDPYYLLKEARETWEYFITDELVHVVEGRSISRPTGFSCVENYLSGTNWIELAIEAKIGTRVEHYIAIIENAVEINPSKSRHGREHDSRHMPHSGNGAMLVSVPHVIYGEERVTVRHIPACVRLKVLDELDFRAVGLSYPGNLLSPSRFGSIRPWFFIEDWELGELGRSMPRTTRKRPRKLVKSGAKIVSELSNEDTESLGRLSVDFEPYDLVRSLVIWLDDKGVGLQRIVSSEVPHNRVQMFLRPLNFEPWPIKWMHEIQYLYEQEKRVSKNPEGSRDSSSYEGRIRGDLGQGGEAGERITDSPPEEELARTSPVHHPGGYTAKHIRSGSPEDA